MGDNVFFTQENTKDVINLLPQKYPLRMVDKITYIKRKEKIHGVKLFSISDCNLFSNTMDIPWFIIMEAMGQIAEILIRASYSAEGKRAYLVSVNNFHLFEKCRIGDVLLIKNQLLHVFNGIYKSRVESQCDTIRIAEGIMTHAFR